MSSISNVQDSPNVTVDNLIRTADELIEYQLSFQNINDTFKSGVGDLRFFLREYGRFLDEYLLNFENTNFEQEKILSSLFPGFYSSKDILVKKITDVFKSLHIDDKQEYKLYKDYYQKQLHDILLPSPFNNRMYAKPLGYAGDFEMMRIIHRHEFSGSSLLAKMLDKYSSSIPISKGVRERTKYLTKRIVDFVRQNPKKEVNIFSIACGPCLELMDLLKKYPDVSNNIKITLLDQEELALNFAKDKLNIYKKEVGSKIEFRFIHQAVGDYLKILARKRETERYDFVYAFGLFDYFDQKTANFVVKNLKPIVNKNGKILISNFSLDSHPHDIYMELSYEWCLVYRSKEQLIELGENNNCDYSFDEIENGIMKFLEITC